MGRTVAKKSTIVKKSVATKGARKSAPAAKASVKLSIKKSTSRAAAKKSTKPKSASFTNSIKNSASTTMVLKNTTPVFKFKLQTTVTKTITLR